MKIIKNTLIAVFLLITTNSCKWWEEAFGPKPAPAPQGIVVTVKDKTTGKPIANANVKWIKAEKEGSGPTSVDGV